MIRNSLVAYNTGTLGAGVYLYSGGRIENSTIIRNSPGKDVNFRRDYKDKIGMQNSIATSISTDSAGDDKANPIAHNNCLLSMPALGEWYDTVLVADEAGIGFVDPDNGDFRLRFDSPCVNAGAILADWQSASDALDLAGNPRLDRFSKKIDIGCYEFLPRGLLLQLR